MRDRRIRYSPQGQGEIDVKANIVDLVNSNQISLEDAVKEIAETLGSDWWSVDNAAIHLHVDSLIVRSVLSNFGIAEWEDEEDESCETFRLATDTVYVVRYLSDEDLESRYYDIHGIDGFGLFYPSKAEIREWFETSLCEIHGYPDRSFSHQAKSVCSCD